MGNGLVCQSSCEHLTQSQFAPRFIYLSPIKRLQSVPALAHIHVFARYKSSEEMNTWNSKTT